MEFTQQIAILDSNVWSYHLPVPIAVSNHFLEQKIKRLIATFNKEIELHCALMPKGDGSYFININKEIRKKLGSFVGDEIHIHLREDTSKYGMPLPEEMEALLEIDEEGNNYFHALTPGKQRSLLYMVGKPKNSDTRLKKALAIIDYLKYVKGKLDFKELNQWFKEHKE